MNKRPRTAMKGASRACPALVLVIALALSAAPAAAQTAAEAQKPLQYDISVTLKLVQAYVTGRDGRPVADLTPGEFEVIDNGQRVPVTHFERHFLGKAEETTGAPAPGPRMSRKFFLLFDFVFIDTHGALKARNAGLNFIDAELRPGDEVGLLTYTTFRGLVLHEYLTTDHARIRRIVDGFGLKHVTGRAENLSDFISRNGLEEPTPRQGAQASQPEDFVERQARLEAGQQVDEGVRQGYVDRAQRFVGSLDNFARLLRYIPGFKNIVLFSGGLARSVLFGKKGKAMPGARSAQEDLISEMKRYDSGLADLGLREDYTNMLEQFKASNSPVYAVDVSRGQKETDIMNQAGTASVVQEMDGADSLRQFASGTGGKFFANTVDTKKIMDDIQDITGAYYVLGYAVSEKWDGRFHKIRVRVKRKGCDVMAQGGYFSPKSFKEYTSFEKLLHVIDLALSDAPQLQIPAEIPMAALVVTVKGSGQLAVFTRASRAAHGDVLGKKAEAYLLLLDESGEVSLIKRFRLSIPDDKAGKEIFLPSFLLPVKPGRYTCRIVLRNMDTGRGARGSVSLLVPATPAAPVVLDPPLLLALDARSLDLAASEADSLSAVFAYDANSYAPFVTAVPAGLNKIFAALRCSSNIPNPDFEISASLQGGAAAAESGVPVSILKESQDGPTFRILTELGTGELRPGRYRLKIIVSEKKAAGTASTSVDFIVK